MPGKRLPLARTSSHLALDAGVPVAAVVVALVAADVAVADVARQPFLLMSESTILQRLGSCWKKAAMAIRTPPRNVADLDYHQPRNTLPHAAAAPVVVAAVALPQQPQRPADLGAVGPAPAAEPVVAGLVAEPAAGPVAAAVGLAVAAAVDAASVAQRTVEPHALDPSILLDPRKQMLVEPQRVLGTHLLLPHKTGGGEQQRHELSQQRAGAKALALERHVGSTKRRLRHRPTC
jgi:hypothetical protein